MKRVLRAILILVIAAGAMAVAVGYQAATADPVVRTTRIGLRGYPPSLRDMRVVLLADLHVAGPDMPPARLDRIVAQVNALYPDLVVLAGDFVSDKTIATASYSFPTAVAPLAGLRARFGAVAVLGNHDHDRGAAAARAALAAAGVRVLDNAAMRVGPLALGGIDDAVTGHADLRGTAGRMRRLGGAMVLLSHTPGPFRYLPRDIELMLAGHTHCGQLRPPLIGWVLSAQHYAARYSCGVMGNPGRMVIVTAGLGTSVVPLRYRVPPDMWLVRIGGVTRALSPGAKPSPPRRATR